MAPLWALTNYQQNLPGWSSFSATTVGDTILLPVLAASLLAVFRGQPKPKGKSEGRVMLLGALLGGIGGAAIQLSWVLDDHPRLTWVLPEPHHLSTGGWYHAVFLCATSSMLLALAFGATLRARTLTKAGAVWHIDHAATSPLLLVIVSSTCAFCILVIHDGGSGSSSAVTIASTIAPGVLSIILCLYAAGSHYRKLIPIISWSIALALLVALIAVLWPREPVSLLGLTVALGLSGGAYFRSSNFAHRIGELCFTVCILIVFLVLPLRNPDYISLNLLLAVCTGLIIWVIAAVSPVKTGHRTRYPLRESAMTAIFAVSVPIAAWLLEHGNAGAPVGSFVVLVAAIVFGGLLIPGYKPDMDALMSEEAAQAGVTADPAVSVLARRVALRGISWGIAAVSGLLGLVMAAGPSMGFVYGTGFPELKWWSGAGALLTALVTCVVSLAARKSPLAPAVPSIGGLVVFCLVIAGFTAAPHHPWWWVWVTIAASLVSAWNLETIIANAAMRPQWVVKRNWRHAVAVPIALAAGGVVLLTCANGMVNSNGEPAESFSSLGVFGLGTLTSLLLLMAAGWTLDPYSVGYISGEDDVSDNGKSPKNWARYRLREWLLADFMLVQSLSVVAIWLPSLTIAHIGISGHYNMFNTAAMAATGILFFAPIFMLSLRNAVRHIDEQSSKAQRPSRSVLFGTLPYVSADEEKATVTSFLRSKDGPVSQQEWARAVAVNQLHLSIISIVIVLVSIIGSLGVISGFTSDASTKGALGLSSAGLAKGGEESEREAVSAKEIDD